MIRALAIIRDMTGTILRTKCVVCKDSKSIAIWRKSVFTTFVQKEKLVTALMQPTVITHVPCNTNNDWSQQLKIMYIPELVNLILIFFFSLAICINFGKLKRCTIFFSGANAV